MNHGEVQQLNSGATDPITIAAKPNTLWYLNTSMSYKLLLLLSGYGIDGAEYYNT